MRENRLFNEISRIRNYLLLWLLTSSAYAQTATPIAWTPAAAAPISRYEGQGAAAGGKLYALGGFFDNTNQATKRCDVYNPATNTWTQLADMPEAITHSGTAVDGNFLYQAGGFVGTHPGPITDHVWKYNISTNTWTAFVPLPAARGGGMVVLLGRELHFFGGVIRIGSLYKQDTPEHWALSLDATTPTWITKAPLPNPRNHLGGAVLNGKIYAIGGQHLGKEGTENQRSLHEYDPVSNTWTAKADMPRPLGHMTSSVFPLNNRIVVVAGVTNGPTKVANVIEYDPTTNSWTELTALPAGRQSPVAGAIDGKIVVNSGSNGPVYANTWIGTPAQSTPTITTLSPTRHATAAPRNANVSVTFSQAMNAATASNAALKIHGSQTGNRTLAGKGSFSGGGTNTVTFDPSADFKPGEQVQVSVTSNAKSIAGTAIAKSQVHNFTAASAVASATFAQGQEVTVGFGSNAICSADFNGDGKVDIAASNYYTDISIRLNNGAGNFTAIPDASSTLYSTHLCAADFDNDGDMDIASASSKYPSLLVNLNDGAAHFDSLVVIDMSLKPGDPNYSADDLYAGNSRYITAGDLDADGDVDMAVVSNGVTILANDGTGHFVKYYTTFDVYPYYSEQGDVNVLSLGDVDNDGDLDLVFATYILSKGVAIRLNDGTGHFSGTGVIDLGTYATSVALTDFDQDGDLDMAAIADGKLLLRTNDGTGRFSGSASIAPDTAPSRVRTGDFNGDGAPDIAVIATGKVGIYLNSGTGTFNTPSTFLNQGAGSLTTADFDADGSLDMATLNTSGSNKATIWQNALCASTGTILREYWANVPGRNISDIPLNTLPTSTSQLLLMQTPANVADNYGQRISGYVCAPATGNYTFFIQGDDQAELWLSTDSNPANKQRIASALLAWGWTVNASQQSAPISLVAGKSYYLEVLHKEAGGGDQVRVGWRTPLMAANAEPIIIPGSVLAPALQAPVNLKAQTLSTTKIQLSWLDANSQETGYVIERAASQTGPFTKVDTSGSNIIAYTDSLLQSNTTYYYRVYATSPAGISAYSNVASATTFGCSARGTILREYWVNVPGRNIIDIPLNTPPTSSSQLTSLRTAANAADNYGQRLRGFLCAPATGNYTFFIQGDDKAELWLSTDNNPANKQRIASANLAWGWTVNASQQSVPISLIAGSSYYVEVLHKESTGGDQLRVGWRTPSMAANAEPIILPGAVLSPFVVPANSSAREAISEQPAVEVLTDELMASPNPFSERVTIGFTTALTEPARLEVYDLQGRRVEQLFEGLSQAGELHQLGFDGSRLSQGMYLIKLATARQVSYQKLLLTK